MGDNDKMVMLIMLGMKMVVMIGVIKKVHCGKKFRFFLKKQFTGPGPIFIRNLWKLVDLNKKVLFIPLIISFSY